MTILIEVNESGAVEKISSINGGFLQSASVHELDKTIKDLVAELIKKHEQGWLV